MSKNRNDLGLFEGQPDDVIHEFVIEDHHSELPEIVFEPERRDYSPYGGNKSKKIRISKNVPHQGHREIQRRRRQMAKQAIKTGKMMGGIDILLVCW